MTSALSWVAKMFEPSWPQLNPYFPQTFNDKAWRLMQIEALPLEPSGAWLSTNHLTRSAQDRVNCKWGTRERSGGGKVVGGFQGIPRLHFAGKCAVAARRTRSSTVGTEARRSSAEGLVFRLLRDGS